jgi:hypothetical protein
MLKMRNLFIGLAVFMGLACSFLVGRGMAQQQPLPMEQIAPFAFPAAWGDLNSVTPTSIGFAYVFVSRSDGTIRVAQGTGAGIAIIQTIPRR